ncbi:MAG: DUF2007 domain-containing protein [Clostridia bacterium]|nr:DUF2007 domain-containing protein [Clostridia bacterium]
MDSFFGLDRVSAHDDSLALLTTVYDPAQLLILESILKDAEIPYLKKERGGGTSVRVIAGFSVFGTDLFVRREQLELALELITPPEQIEDTEEEA